MNATSLRLYTEENITVHVTDHTFCWFPSIEQAKLAKVLQERESVLANGYCFCFAYCKIRY